MAWYSAIMGARRDNNQPHQLVLKCSLVFRHFQSIIVWVFFSKTCVSISV